MSQAMFAQAEEPEEQYEGFQITDDIMAEWAVQKIREAQSDTAFWKKHYDDQLAKIKKANDGTVAAMTGFLAHYFATVPHRTTTTQTKYELPSATLMRKKRDPDYQFEDDKLVEYFDTSKYPEFVKVVRKPKWGDFKKITDVNEKGELYVKDTGEIVPCVTVVPKQDAFTVNLKGE